MPIIKCRFCGLDFEQHMPTPPGQQTKEVHFTTYSNNADIEYCTLCATEEIPGDRPGGPGDVVPSSSAVTWPPSPPLAAPVAPPTFPVPPRLSATTIYVSMNYANYEHALVMDMVNARTITLGDLHGNTMTLLIILLRCGALCPLRAMTDREVNFAVNMMGDIVRSVSLDHPLTVINYWNFKRELDKFTVNLNAPSLRLIGDVLADRVSNDVLTLALLHKLIQNHYSITIIYSNHDNELFVYMATYGVEEAQIPYNMENLDEFLASHMRWRAFLAHLINSRSVIIEDILASLKSYVGCLKMFDYQYPIFDDSGRGPPFFYLYTHASFNLDLFNKFIQQLWAPNTPPFLTEASSPEQLRGIVDESNRLLTQILKPIVDAFVYSVNFRQRYYKFPIEAQERLRRYQNSRFAKLFGRTMEHNRNTFGEGILGFGYKIIWYRFRDQPNAAKIPFPYFSNVHGHDAQVARRADTTYDQPRGKDTNDLLDNLAPELALEIIEVV